MNFIYILKCSDNTLYTGWTTDLLRRLKTHQSGKASKYTRARLPVEMVYSESFLTKSEAMKREAAIKKLKRHEKLTLISNQK
ncbi:MAG: GIY-YIG nuclease family protein [Clostridium sp.]